MYVDLQCSSHQNAAILNFLLIFLFSQAVNTRRSINQYFFFCVKVYLIIIFIHSISISISSLTSSFIHSTPLQLIKNIHEGFFYLLRNMAPYTMILDTLGIGDLQP